MANSTVLPSRNKALIDLLEASASMTKGLTRALKFGVNDFNKHTGSVVEELINDIKTCNKLSVDLLKQLPRPPVNYMARTVEDWFNNSSEREKEEFLTTDFDNLVVFMAPLGRKIMDRFNLWMYSWVPDIRDNIDKSPQHPEAIALQVIETVWRNVKND